MPLQFLKCVGKPVENRDLTERGFPVLKMNTENVQVGIALGSIGPCEIKGNHRWCPDIFTDLVHPNINNFVNQVKSM